MSKKINIKEKEDYQTQPRIEEAVLNYQRCVKTNSPALIEEAYQKICRIYDPMSFQASWYEKYKYLYDTHDDFLGDYLRIFSSVLIGWKPREKRNASRYDGTGEFKNYFIGSLNHNYINMVKSDQAGKRNVSQKCPICEEWVSPLSTHLINHHSFLLYDQLSLMNIDINNISNCPLCSAFKPHKYKTPDDLNDAIRKHLLVKHTSFLFNRFHHLYPDHVTISPKTSSIHIEEGNEELDITDTIEGSNMINNLMSLNLSPLQELMISKVLSGSNNLSYDRDFFGCTQEEYQLELEKLQEAMVICGASV